MKDSAQRSPASASEIGRQERVIRLQRQLPRLGELHARFVRKHRDNFFRHFANWFDESEVTLRHYEQIERDLSFIPASDWEAYAAKIGEVVNAYDRAKRREWEKLFDVFSEALGARVLVEKYGCDVVRLMATSTKSKSCDWFGSAAGKPHYLEVKTLNHSDDERKSWFKEAKLVHTSFVPVALLKKAEDSYKKARTQLDAMPGAAEAKKVVLFVIHADHNFDPFDGTVHDLLLREFAKFEDPAYEMQLAIHTPNDGRR